ncbi:MAG: hypothetical protein KTR35_14180, partial [Gammaproteobacteria bacterium]|nr:hypothetical protein [Gammaproteobacteria bacterium]
RHRGLFGAAWAVGVLAATQGSAVEALCLAAPTGPFGIIYSRQHYPQLGYDDDNAVVYPLYHVVLAACQMQGAPRLSFNGLPDAIAAYGVYQQSEHNVILANVSDKSITVPLAHPAAIVVLNSVNVEHAVADADWLDNAQLRTETQLELDPFAVVFATWSTRNEGT